MDGVQFQETKIARYVNDKIQSRTAAALFNLSFTTGKRV